MSRALCDNCFKLFCLILHSCKTFLRQLTQFSAVRNATKTGSVRLLLSAILAIFIVRWVTSHMKLYFPFNDECYDRDDATRAFADDRKSAIDFPPIIVWRKSKGRWWRETFISKNLMVGKLLELNGRKFLYSDWDIRNLMLWDSIRNIKLHLLIVWILFGILYSSYSRL